MLQVQAVLLLLGGCEVPTGAAGMTLSGQQDDRVILHHSSRLDHLEGNYVPVHWFLTAYLNRVMMIYFIEQIFLQKGLLR